MTLPDSANAPAGAVNAVFHAVAASSARGFGPGLLLS